MIENKKKIIITSLVILEIISLFLVYKTFPRNKTILDEVKLQENTIKNDSFALMLQKEDGTYEKSNSSSWPTNMVFNAELSGCIDTNGNKIDNSLSFDKTNNIVNVSVGETSYCYVYFDMVGNMLFEYLIENVSSDELWDSPLEGDGYRYIGIDPNNYICFGTNDKDTCTSDTGKYMYRIIGIFDDESGNRHTKLIKKEALSEVHSWHEGTDYDIYWYEGDLFSNLNNSYFLTDTSYSYMQDTSWINKISTWNFSMVNTNFGYDWDGNQDIPYGLYYGGNTGEVIYLHELNRSGKSNDTCYNGEQVVNCNDGLWYMFTAKIGLMYISDYALSLGSETLKWISNSNASNLKTGWMHISNNDSNVVNDIYGQMEIVSAFGQQIDINADASNYFIEGNGMIDVHTYDCPASVRPVFYLEPSVELLSGTGSESDPYIIK